MDWLKKNGRSIALAISVLLNILGGTGVIPPVIGKAVSAGINATATP